MSDQQTTTVVHCKRSTYDVYIGRPSMWGNPFVIGRDGNRQEVIEKYRAWVLRQPHLMARVYTLRGKRLACWCKPAACHGDVLAELAEHTEQPEAPTRAEQQAEAEMLARLGGCFLPEGAEA